MQALGTSSSSRVCCSSHHYWYGLYRSQRSSLATSFWRVLSVLLSMYDCLGTESGLKSPRFLFCPIRPGGQDETEGGVTERAASTGSWGPKSCQRKNHVLTLMVS